VNRSLRREIGAPTGVSQVSGEPNHTDAKSEAYAMNELLSGAVAMGTAVSALFFFKFWRKTHDRLFAFFALSLAAIAANRVASAALSADEPGSPVLYWIRFGAFLLILIAILDKNSGRRAASAR
jgi:hypothetical protein